jgi:uncharacterized protein YbjT (DUF2867 family)
MTPEKKIKALVIGHTGATGSALVSILEKMPECESIIAIGRRENKAFLNSSKVVQYVLPNMLDIENLDKNLLPGVNASFCCIGTTFNDVFKSSKADEYLAVDFGIATGFAKLAKSVDSEFFGIITGDKSDSNSKMRMTRVKGQTEDVVNALGFNRVAILRPGLLNRGDGRRGWMEQIATVGGIFGTPVSDIARAMIWNALTQNETKKSYESIDIKKSILNYKFKYKE